MNSSARILYIDYLRAICVLYIVGYWHLFNYTSYFRDYDNVYTRVATLIILGLFVFISGYLLAVNYGDKASVGTFFLKRFLRIYPLYALAVAMFYYYGINDADVLVKSLYLISMYQGPPPYTLWFITMLMAFYLITPILMLASRNDFVFLLFTLGPLIATAIYSFNTDGVDLRLLLYYPCFCAGIYCARNGIVTGAFNFWTAILMLLFGLALHRLPIQSPQLDHLSQVPLIIGGLYLVIGFCDAFSRFFVKLRLIMLLSYCSFSMYLFHRPVYVAIKQVYFPVDPLDQFLYLLLIGVTLTLVIAWFVQKFYDAIYFKVLSVFGCK